MAKNARKKKKHPARFVFLILLLALSVYMGKMLAEYTWNNNRDDIINKYAKPIEDDKSALEGAQGDGNTSSSSIIPENDIITLTAVTTEFITAEHMKKADRLASLVDPGYYSTFLKKMNTLKTAEVTASDMNFEKISKDAVKVVAKYSINTKSYSESISLRLLNDKWKVYNVSISAI
jgi:hypothetical protein